MFDFGRGSALDPAGKLIALPQNHSWIYRVLRLTEYKPVSYYKITSFSHSGKLTGIVSTKA